MFKGECPRHYGQMYSIQHFCVFMKSSLKYSMACLNTTSKDLTQFTMAFPRYLQKWNYYFEVMFDQKLVEKSYLKGSE